MSNKQPFQMTEEEFEQMKSISQRRSPVMKFGDYISGMDTQERANDFWKALASKYGFVWDSAEGNGSDPKTFLAIPQQVKQ